MVSTGLVRSKENTEESKRKEKEKPEYFTILLSSLEKGDLVQNFISFLGDLHNSRQHENSS